MAETKQVQARIQQQYKRENMTLLSGIGFSKNSWTIVPKERVEEARRELSEILDFREVTAGILAEEADPMTKAGQVLKDREAQEEVEAEKVSPISPSETDENTEEDKTPSIPPEKKTYRRRVKKDLDE